MASAFRVLRVASIGQTLRAVRAFDVDEPLSCARRLCALACRLRLRQRGVAEKRRPPRREYLPLCGLRIGREFA
eukprot:11222386-Lingulodinium_polyedra.AAC.1